MLLRCGEQYRRRYVEREIIPPSGSLVRGKCDHRAIEVNFRQKIDTSTDLPVEAVKDFFSDEWEKEKYTIGWTDEELDGESIKKAEARYKDTGIALVEVYHTEVAPSAIPVAVEDKFTVHFEGGYPDLVGIIDRVDEGDQIIDCKFVGKSPAANDIENDIQLTAYDLGYRQTRKKKPNVLRKEFAVATKTPKTVVQEAEARPDDTITRFLFRLEKAMEIISKGIFAPAGNGVWWCSPRFCGYWHSCKYRP
jgi:hypothetical protein